MPRVLVVVAHPDDAEIAAGGTIARLVDDGAHVVNAVLTIPEEGEGAVFRREAAEKASGVLGCELHWVADGVHRQVSDIGEVGLVGLLDEVLTECAPTVVLTHWSGDGHVDHVLTARATVAATRKSACDLYHFRPGEMRTPAFLGFQPAAFVDITAQAARKRDALAAYGGARGGFRALDLDAIDQADRFYGAIVGRDRAEGFMVARQHGLGSRTSGLAW